MSWNLALMKRSAQAPHTWGIENTEAAFREIALAHSPDIIVLQELPAMVPFVETHGMIRANPESHSGHLATLVKHELIARGPTVVTVVGCAILATFDDDLTVANVHLAPGTGKRSEAQRLGQLARIVEASPTPELLIVGDTNTRVGEVDTLESAGLRGARPPRPTWDSRVNRFNSMRDSHEFRAYFTRWFASPGVSVSDLTVLDSPIETDGHSFHLSDHFGLFGRVHTKGV
jgi:endonuclease/exonuclease/phosphatase family metal-dependent hydrolase